MKLEGVRLRLRPILMTSLAFILLYTGNFYLVEKVAGAARAHGTAPKALPVPGRED